MNAVLLRLVRVAISTGLGVLATVYGQNQYYIALTPVLAALGKALRDLFPGKFEWLPV
jgi:hypothetical protein